MSYNSTPVANIIKKDVEQGFNNLFKAIEDNDIEKLVSNFKRIADAQNYVGFGDYASIKTSQKLFRLGNDKQDTFMFIVAKALEDKGIKDSVGIDIKKENIDLKNNYLVNVYDLDDVNFSKVDMEKELILITKALRRISRDYRGKEVLEYNAIEFSDNMNKII